MIDKIRIALNQFKEKHTKYNLFIPNTKIGSEHYILSQLYKELNPIQVIYGYDDLITNEYPIVILDDAIYSSCNICGHIDELTFNKNVNNNFYAIVAILSTPNVCLKQFNATIIAESTLTHLLPSKLFNDYDEDYFYHHFGCESSKVLPLIFEHKIANAFGSYQFYHQLLTKPISRACINAITQENINDIINYYKNS